MRAATLGLVLNFGIGTIGLWWLGDGKWELGECAYMVVITLTTVGFGEVLPEFAATPYARAFAVYLMIFGTGTVLYFVSNLAAAIISMPARWSSRSTATRRGSTGCSPTAAATSRC